MRTKIINETISVDESGNASCIQEIIYKNHNDKPLGFSGIIKIGFHEDCNDFQFIEDIDLIAANIVQIREQPYRKELHFHIPKKIPPKGSITLKLQYVWRNFRDESGFRRIATKFDSLTDYNLSIVVRDDTFTDHLISVTDGDTPLERDKNYFVTAEGHLRIIRQHLSSNTNQNIRIIANIKKIPLPVVNDIAKKYKGCFSRDYCILVILHVLRDFLAFRDGLLAMGINKKDLFIVGIPYSSKEEVIEYLRYSSFRVYSVERDHYIDQFNELVERAIKEALEHCKQTNKKLLIIEDGGYAVPLIHEKFIDLVELCIGAVEQTANGIWIDRELQRSGTLLFPVMNVAEARIKKEKESPLVGQAIIQNINRLLEGYGYGITSMKVGQIGFGNIGKPLGLQMKNDGVDLTIYDIDEKKCEDARRNEIHVVKNMTELLEGKNLIVGCSGRELIGLQELRAADRNIFFVNATSKLKEIKYNEFIMIADKIKVRRGIGTEYKLKGGRRIIIRLLANGFPVNFFEGSESIPDKQIQFIPALLLASAGYLVTKQINERKIIDIPEEIQNNIVKLMNLHEESQ